MGRGIAAFVVGVFIPLSATAQVPGQIVRAKDGDTILVENDDKVKVVRRRHANVRVLHNPEQRWIIVLADWLGGDRGGDGVVDYVFDFRDVAGEWPLGPRWEGTVYLDQYDMAGAAPHRGMGLATASGLLQLLGTAPEGRTLGTDRTFADPAAVAVMTFRGSGSSMQRDAFDIAEQRALSRLAQEPAGGPVMGPGGVRASVSLSAVEVPSNYSGGQPVRVGSNIRSPQKIKHVEAVRPPAAQQADVFGMVVLEITIGSDGTVQSAKPLRSIPMLDQAAIDAVKQWVYEPTHLNGAPVPVIMTVTVNFR